MQDNLNLSLEKSIHGSDRSGQECKVKRVPLYISANACTSRDTCSIEFQYRLVYLISLEDSKDEEWTIKRFNLIKEVR